MRRGASVKLLVSIQARRASAANLEFQQGNKLSPTNLFSSECADNGSALADRLRHHVQRLAGDIGERNVWRPKALREDLARDHAARTQPVVSISNDKRPAKVSSKNRT